MDVSQVKQDIDSPFNWSASYAGEKSDDFARHLSSNDEADRPEPKEKVRAKDRHEPDRDDDRIDDHDDRADSEQEVSAKDKPLDTDTSQVAAVTTAPVFDPNATASGSKVTSAEGSSSAILSAATQTGTSNQGTNTGTISGTENKNGKNTGLENALNQVQQNGNPKAAAAVSENIQKQSAEVVDPKLTSQKAASSPAASAAVSAVATQSANTQSTNAKSSNNASASASPNANKTQVATDTPKAVNEQASQAKPELATSALEKMRSDEMAKMSEKDVLSSQISELLAKGKGKISMVGAAKTSATTQGGMISNNNAMIAAGQTTPPQVTPKTDTAIGMITQSAQQAEMPIIVPNGDLGGSLIVPQQPIETPLTSNNAVIGGAIAGIDQTSTNSVSQASMAGRAMAQAGSPAEQVATQISTAVKDGANQIKVQLHPADLGRVDIKLELGQDGRVMAIISADNADSLDLLQQDSKQLEKTLQDAGFETGSDSLSFSLNQGSDQDTAEDGTSKTASNSANGAEDEAALDPAILTGASDSTSGLDIQV